MPTIKESCQIEAKLADAGEKGRRILLAAAVCAPLVLPQTDYSNPVYAGENTTQKTMAENETPKKSFARRALSSIADYLTNRVNDARDIVSAEVGISRLMTGAKLKATDLLWVGVLGGNALYPTIGIGKEKQETAVESFVPAAGGFYINWINFGIERHMGDKVPLGTLAATYNQGAMGLVSSTTTILIPYGKSKDEVLGGFGKKYIQDASACHRIHATELREILKRRMVYGQPNQYPTKSNESIVLFEEEYYIGTAFLGGRKIYAANFYGFGRSNLRDFIIPRDTPVYEGIDYTYLGAEPLIPRELIKWLDLEAEAACVLVGAKVSIRPGEIIDLAAGVFGLDPAGDDGAKRADKNKPPWMKESNGKRFQRIRDLRPRYAR